jgi:hypothetical protein
MVSWDGNTVSSTKLSDLVESFVSIREQLCRLEILLGDFQGDLKEFDKSVTVMKVGAKVMKKRLKTLGYEGLGREAKERCQ